MATLAELHDALVNADKAGDEEAARQLADAIYQMRNKRTITDSFSTDPTAGMSNTEKFLAGAGKAFNDTWEGTKQFGAEFAHLAGIGSRETAQRLRKEADERKRLDAPLMDTGAGIAGNIAGHIATSISPGVALKGIGLVNAGKALLAPQTLKGAAALGAGYSALQPVGEEDSRLANAAIGAAGSAGGQLLGRGIHSAWEGGKALLRPLSEAGREKIVGNTLNHYASNPNAVMGKLQNAPQYVPGSVPTLAEAADDVGISQLQRTLQNFPHANAAITERGIENNAARLRVLESMVGDDIAMATAKQARKDAIEPLRAVIRQSKEQAVPKQAASYIDRVLKSATGQREGVSKGLESIREKLVLDYPIEERIRDSLKLLTNLIDNPLKGGGRFMSNIVKLENAKAVVNGLKRGVIDEKTAIRELNNLQPKFKPYADAIKSVKEKLKSQTKYETSPEQLYGIRDHISDLLNAKNPDGSKTFTAISRELSGIQKMIDRSIKQQVPEYGKYLSEYTRLSRPINQMQISKQILDKSTSKLERVGGNPALYPEKYAKSLTDIQSMVAKNSGYKRAKGLGDVFEPDQIKALEGIKADLARSESGKNLGRAVGSNTSQNLASMDIMRNFLGPLGIPDSAADSKIVRNLVGPLDVMGKLTAEELDILFSEVAKNPKLAAELMQKAPGVRGLLSAPTRAAITYTPMGLLGSYSAQ